MNCVTVRFLDKLELKNVFHLHELPAIACEVLRDEYGITTPSRPEVNRLCADVLEQLRHKHPYTYVAIKS